MSPHERRVQEVLRAATVGRTREEIERILAKMTIPFRDATLASVIGHLLRDPRRVPELPVGDRCDADCPGWMLRVDSDEDYPVVERCDECARFHDDIEAAVAYAESVGGSVRIHVEK